MEIALILFNKLLSLFSIIALGFAAVRAGLIRSEDSRSVAMLALYIICPFAIMNAFEVNPTPEILGGMALSVVFALLTHAVFISLMRLLKKPLKLSDIERASIIYSNAGNLTIPVVNAMLGSEWVIYICAYNLVQICLQWTHLRILVSGERRINFRKMLLNPNMISIYLGVFIFFTGFRFPGPIDSAIDSVAAMIGPVCMLITGMMIGGMQLKEVFSRRRAWLISMTRLLVMPFIMVCIARCGITSLVPDGKTVLLISILCLSGPSGTTVMQMAQIYSSRDTAEYASSINVISMLMCAITMPLIVAFYYL